MIPRAVAALVATNIATFVWELRSMDGGALVNGLAFVPYNLIAGISLLVPVALTPLTSQFVHGSWQHLAINVAFLALFGTHVERLSGPVRFVGLYLCCGAIGALAILATDPASHVPVVGASGAISGMIGAYLVTIDREPRRLEGYRGAALSLALLWVIAQFTLTFWVNAAGASGTGGTAYFAHIGGFLAGALLMPLFSRRVVTGEPHSAEKH